MYEVDPFSIIVILNFDMSTREIVSATVKVQEVDPGIYTDSMIGKSNFASVSTE